MTTEATIERWKLQGKDVPILPLEKLAELPGPEEYEGGIYFLWQGGTLLYIGRSTNLCERFYFFKTAAKRNPQFDISVALQKIVHFDKMTCLVLQTGIEIEPWLRPMLQRYERAYIAHYLPGMNEDFQAEGLT